MGAIRIGCSGWQYRHWRGVLYPEGLAQRRWLARYAEAFDTVEVNATFYRLARETAVAAWVEQTPEDFVFSVKGSRYITHLKRLRDCEEAIARFWAPLRPLRDAGRLGPVLWQLPERDTADLPRLAAFLELLPEAQHVLEVRHASWLSGAVLDLLAEHRVGLVVGHDARRPLDIPLVATAPWAFVRFHYGAHAPRGDYDDRELEAWAGALERLARDADVWAYFNNDWEGFAIRDARVMRELLGARAAAAPG